MTFLNKCDESEIDIYKEYFKEHLAKILVGKTATIKHSKTNFDHSK